MAMAACSQCGGAVPEQARFCPHCAAPTTPDLPTEERKIATILFADLVGSTELGASQDPERTRAMLGRFFQAMSAEVEATGGTVEKFVGDAVMAAFGTPTAHEDDAERALRAGVAMRHRLRELFGDQLALRIGVDTGEVVVGYSREGSFVTGDAVNIAARLEQTAAPGEIVVGERTASAAIGAFEFSDPETIDVKGRRGVVRRRLLRELDGRRPRGVGNLRPAFVGRERELDSLLDEYRQAVAARRPRLLTLIGEAGVGKTALAERLWERLDGESPRPLRLVGRCPSYGRAITYAPLAEILRSGLGLLESDEPARVLERLGPRPILGLTLGLDVAGDQHPLRAQERLQEAWVDFLAAFGPAQPLLIVLEDLHWGEEPLLDLVERVISDLQAPLMVVATARPDLPDEWRARLAESGTLLEVDLLSRRDSQRLLRETLDADLPPAVLEEVLTRAEGNPFFLEELLGALIDSGVLRREGADGWTTASLPEALVIPDSVHATLASRIDLLERPEKEALQAAAIVGRVFWTSAVYELLPEVTPDVRVLESRGFIRRRPHSALEGEREYAIKHALTREVAYGSVPKARRAHLHARFAEWLERRGAGRDEHAALLAHHYFEAVNPEAYNLAWAGEPQEGQHLRDKAATWLRRAGELGIGRYEIDDALALLERALLLTRDEGERAGVWRTIGRARALKFDGDGFWIAMRRAIDATDETRDPHVAAQMYAALALQTAVRPAMWKRNPDRELVDGWIERAVELAPLDTRARAEALVARAFWHRLDNRAADDAREGAAIAESLRAVDLLSYAFSARALGALASSDYAEAEEATHHRLALLPELSDPDHQADVYWSAMIVNTALGRIAEARRLARLNDEINSLLTPHHRVHGIAARLRVEELCGHWDVIRELQRDAESRVAANSETPCSDNVFCLLVCALARTELGDETEATRLELAADQLGFEGYVGDHAGPRIRLALSRGELGDLEDLLLALQEVGPPSLTSRAARIDALVALGRAPEVEEEAETLLLSPYLEPFALRALAVATDDLTLLERAVDRFTAQELYWHAAQTPSLAPSRP
jgi:class 3 adenylate cyclase